MEHLKNLLRGAGSLIDIAPVRNLRQVVPCRTGAERMASHFGRVGESVTRACGAFADYDKTRHPKAD